MAHPFPVSFQYVCVLRRTYNGTLPFSHDSALPFCISYAGAPGRHLQTRRDSTRKLITSPVITQTGKLPASRNLRPGGRASSCLPHSQKNTAHTEKLRETSRNHSGEGSSFVYFAHIPCFLLSLLPPRTVSYPLRNNF